MISPAMINPATEGTKALLPGTLRRSGGQSVSIPSRGVNGFSVEKRTFTSFRLRFLHSFLMTRASGQTEVSEIIEEYVSAIGYVIFIPIFFVIDNIKCF